MLTMRQIERLWDAGQYERITSACMEMRIETSARLQVQLSGLAPAAAIAVIRMDELCQAHMPLFSRLVRSILAAQQADGGWGEPLTTALCVRALMCSNGAGPAIDRGIAYLAALQKSEGIWPKIAFRRMPADPFVSAFVLFCLIDDERFAHAVRLDDALRWFKVNQPSLDGETAKLWRNVGLRHPAPAPREMAHLLS